MTLLCVFRRRYMYLGTGTWAKSQGFDQDKPSVKEYHEQTYGKDMGYKEFIGLLKKHRVKFHVKNSLSSWKGEIE